MTLFPKLAAAVAEAQEMNGNHAKSHDRAPYGSQGGKANAQYVPHPRATSVQLEAAVKDVEPSAEVMTPLAPRPHPCAALIVTPLPPASEAIPHNHPLRRSPLVRILVWQLCTYARDVHVHYQQWHFIDADQCLALPWIFSTQEMARRFLAMRRVARVQDTPAQERGSLGEVHWSESAIASITPETLKPFGT